MNKLNLSNIDLDLLTQKENLKTRDSEQVKQIWDPIRKKWLVLQPEELIRQLLIYTLIMKYGCSAGRMVSEKSLQTLYPTLRFDLGVYSSQNEMALLCECKAFDQPINQRAIFQLCQYNRAMEVPILLWTNGPDAYIAVKSKSDMNYRFVSRLSEFEEALTAKL